MRTKFVLVAFGSLALVAVGSYFWPFLVFVLIPIMGLTALGLVDMFQTKQAIRRNFPVLGQGRYLLESIRPEINHAHTFNPLGSQTGTSIMPAPPSTHRGPLQASRLPRPILE